MQEVDSQASLDAHVTERQSRTVLSKSNLIIHGMLEYLSPLPQQGAMGLGPRLFQELVSGLLKALIHYTECGFAGFPTLALLCC